MESHNDNELRVSGPGESHLERECTETPVSAYQGQKST